MKRFCISAAGIPAVLLLMILTGCLNVEYTGQQLPEISETIPVEFYTESQSLPPDLYRPIGRAIVKCPADVTNGAIKTALIERAREVGAEVVKLISFEQQSLGVIQQEVTAPGNLPDSPVASLDSQFGERANGSSVYVNSFGEPLSDAVREREVYENCIQALFLVSRERFDTYIGKRQKLQKLMPAAEFIPDPDAPVEWK